MSIKTLEYCEHTDIARRIEAVLTPLAEYTSLRCQQCKDIRAPGSGEHHQAVLAPTHYWDTIGALPYKQLAYIREKGALTMVYPHPYDGTRVNIEEGTGRVCHNHHERSAPCDYEEVKHPFALGNYVRLMVDPKEGHHPGLPYLRCMVVKITQAGTLTFASNTDTMEVWFEGERQGSPAVLNNLGGIPGVLDLKALMLQW